jgi:hypothetical protein
LIVDGGGGVRNSFAGERVPFFSHAKSEELTNPLLSPDGDDVSRLSMTGDTRKSLSLNNEQQQQHAYPPRSLIDDLISNANLRKRTLSMGGGRGSSATSSYDLGVIDGLMPPSDAAKSTPDPSTPYDYVSVDTVLLGGSKSPTYYRLQKFGATIFVFWGGLSMACFIESITTIWEILGSSISILIAFLIPAMSYLALRKVKKSGGDGGKGYQKLELSEEEGRSRSCCPSYDGEDRGNDDDDDDGKVDDSDEEDDETADAEEDDSDSTNLLEAEEGGNKSKRQTKNKPPHKKKDHQKKVPSICQRLFGTWTNRRRFMSWCMIVVGIPTMIICTISSIIDIAGRN